MSKLLWHTVTISIPDKMVIKTKTGKTSLKQTLTELNSLVKAGGYPAIKLVNSNDNKVHVIDEGQKIEETKPSKLQTEPSNASLSKEEQIIKIRNEKPKKKMIYDYKYKPEFDIKNMDIFKATPILLEAVIDYFKEDKKEEISIDSKTSRDALLKIIDSHNIPLDRLAFYYNYNITYQIYRNPSNNEYIEKLKTLYIKKLPKNAKKQITDEDNLNEEIKKKPKKEKPKIGGTPSRAAEEEIKEEIKEEVKKKPKKEKPKKEEIKDEIKEEVKKKPKEEVKKKPKKIKEEKPQESKTDDIFKSLKLFQNALYIYFDKEGNSIVNMLDFKTTTNEDLYDLIKIHKVPIEEVIKIHDNLIYKELIKNPTKTDYINRLKSFLINKDDDEDD